LLPGFERDEYSGKWYALKIKVVEALIIYKLPQLTEVQRARDVTVNGHF
jgi:hypothetical protein